MTFGLKETELIVVPYVLGHECVGMGAGPLVLESGVVAALQPARAHRIGLSEPFAHEIGACFDLNRQLAQAVAAAAARGAVPVVLTGNCHSQQAVVAGVGTDGLGLVWLDCHADFHTLETTTSGFFDATAISMIVGDCCHALCASVPGFALLDGDRVVLVGARDVDPGERSRLDASAVVEVGVDDIAALPAKLRGFDRVSLHVDLDVLDPADGRANPFAVGPGLRRDALLAAVRAVADTRPLAAVTLSAYDPACDDDGRVRETAVALLAALATD
jgi:arginase